MGAVASITFSWKFRPFRSNSYGDAPASAIPSFPETYSRNEDQSIEAERRSVGLVVVPALTLGLLPGLGRYANCCSRLRRNGLR
jgi:hypothetical protein